MPDTPHATSDDTTPPRVGLIISVSLIAAITAFMVARAPSEQEPLEPILLATGEWPPYSSEKLADQGIASAIVEAVFEQIGYRTQLRFMAWEPAENAARDNQTNDNVRGTFPYADTADRRRHFYYSEPLLEIPMALYYHRQTFPRGAEVEFLEQLAPFNIVPIKGYRYPERFAPHMAALPPAESINDALQLMVKSDKPLVVIEAARVGDALLTNTPQECQKRIDKLPLSFTSPLHLIASKRNPHNRRLISAFDKALSKLKRQGVIDQISSRAERTPTQPPQATAVTLSPWQDDHSLRGYTSIPADTHILIPRGTKATVTSWGKGWLQPGINPPGSPTAMVKVQLLNGPLAGQTLYVDGRSVLLPKEESHTWTGTTSANPSTHNLCSPLPG